MENIVSARRLRKSMLKNIDSNYINNIEMFSRSNCIKKSHKEEILKTNKKVKINFKLKTSIKILLSTLIVFVCLLGKLLFKDKILQNNKALKIINEYNTDWSKSLIIEKIEYFSKIVYEKTKYIVPDNIKNLITNKYNIVIKPKYLDFSLYNVIKMYNKNNENEVQNIKEIEDENMQDIVPVEETIKEENDSGVGGAEPLEVEETISTISSMDNDIQTIKSKNISIVSPTVGVITSIYGARDEIFEGVNSYHTGVDIANKKGTNITSATTGKVKSVVYNNKYYGNYIEIETEGVIFKYAHMDSIKIGEGSDVKQGEVIGFMGSTGMSTGPHLHFEIKIDSRTVDPQELVNL